MFSGTTFTNYSGSVLGTHQKIDRAAHRILSKTIDMAIFPAIKDVIHFEGRNGPDGIKSKSPGKDEPWHYYNPYDENDRGIIEIIELHYNELVIALRDGNREKSAFEAAWLAHAIVDGLTPAHHYPYEEELERLRGESLESRDSVIKKLIIPADTVRDAVQKNWEMWGSKGLMTTHALFEWGVGLLVAPMNLSKGKLSNSDRHAVTDLGWETIFKQAAVEIADQDIYHAYYRHGWNKKMMNAVKSYLVPRIITVVAQVWYQAIEEATSDA